MTNSYSPRPIVTRILLISVTMLAIHQYLIFQFFEGQLVIPVWLIHVFNAALVLIMYLILLRQIRSGQKKILYTFFGLTLLKMLLILVFLSPLVIKDAEFMRLEIINFFIPYFLYLALEISCIYKFLVKF